jgi:hypothetical protein
LIAFSRAKLRAVGQYISENLHFVPGTDEHLRLVLDHFDLLRLTTQFGTTILDILGKKSDYVTGLDDVPLDVEKREAGVAD